MRLPFLQVAQEEMARARTLAGYLGVPYAHALGMVVALKAAALEAAPDGDVSGDIRDHNPAEWVAVQCGWPLDRAESLAGALTRCGFVVARPSGGHAVAGMEPYARALDTSGKRADAGRRGAEARKARGGYGRAMAAPQHPDGHGIARDAKTQTQTQTEEASGDAPSAPPGQPLLVDVATTPPPTAPKKPSTAVAQWVEEADEARGPLIPSDAPQRSELKKHQWPKLGEAFKAHGALTLTAAHRLFLMDDYARSQAFPLGLFVSQVDTWVGKAQAAAARQRVSGGDVPRLGPRPAPPSPAPSGDKPRI